MKKRKHLLKISAIFMAAVMLFSLSGVTAFAAGATEPGMISEFGSEAVPDIVNAYSDALQTMYDGFMNHDEEINIYNYSVPESEIMAFYQAAKTIYPEIFFIRPNFRYSSTTSGIIYSIFPSYLYSAEETDIMLEQFYDKADRYLSKLDDRMDDFAKAVTLHELLANNNYYALTNSDGSVSANNYTFMVEGWGKCSNYAEVYAYLLSKVGIKSEIVSSESMAHEWLKINLGGENYYYNVDLTWDDPIINNQDRPDKAFHTYFLMSDEMFQTADDITERSAHTGYQSFNGDNEQYDRFDNLHSLTRPLIFINGELYTLYENQPSGSNFIKGYLAKYDYTDDSLTDVYEIDDIWFFSEYSYYPGNFSGLGTHNDLIYFNGTDCIYVYDPATGEKSVYLDNITRENELLYGMYVQDGKIYGAFAQNPAAQFTYEYLGDCIDNFTIGDVNRDGKIDVRDATAIQRHLAAVEKLGTLNLKSADCNGDGNIDIYDATHLQMYLAHYEDVALGGIAA